ncbi:MAG: hypothetical protein Q9222_001669 [Ikaeria aurantiellina]
MSKLPSICGTTQDQPPQKLSKPLTNRSSSNLLTSTSHHFEASSPLALSDAGSADGYFPSVTSPHCQPKGRRNTRSKIRSYFQSSPETDQHHSSEDDESNQRKTTNRNSRHRMSRTDSSIFQNPNVGASAASSASYLCMADARGPENSEDDAVKRHITEKVWIDTLAAQNHVSTPVDEDKHPDSVMSPIRRRSLYTPGIATRSPEDILRKPPPREQVTSQADRDYYYDPTRPACSPLSRLANLRNSHTGRSTPSELDYTHLGTLKLGTLRVTNGAASPVPQNRHDDPVQHLEVASQDDYYTASEGKSEEEDDRLNVGSSSADTSRTSEEDISDVAAIQKTPTTCRSIKRKPLPPKAPSIHHDQSTMPIVNRPVSQRTPHPVLGSPSKESLPRYERRGDLEMRQSFAGVTKHPNKSNEPQEEAYLKLIGRPTPWHNPPDMTTTAHFQNMDSGYSSNTSLEGVRQPTSSEEVDAVIIPSLQSNVPYPTQVPSPPSDRTWEEFQLAIRTESPRVAMSTHKAPTPIHSFNRDSRTRSFSGAAQKGSFVAANDPPTKSSGIPNKEGFSPEKSRKLQKKRPKSQPPLQRISLPANDPMDQSEIPPVPVAIANLHSERVSRFPSLDHTFSSPQHTEPDEVHFSPVSKTDQSAQGPEDLKEDVQPFLKRLVRKARSRSRSKSRARRTSYHSDDDEVDTSEICRSPSWSDYGNRKKKEQKRRQKAERESQNRSDQETSSAKDSEPSRRRFRLRSRSRGRSTQTEHVSTSADIGIIQKSLGVGPYDIALTDPKQSIQRSQGYSHQDIAPREVSKDDVHSGRSRSYSLAGPSLPSTKGIREHNVITKLARPQTMFFDPRAIPAMPVADLRLKNGARNQKHLPQHRDPQPVEHRSQEPELSRQGTSTMDNPRVSESTGDPPSVSMKHSSVDTTTSIEALIDALLDASSVEAREEILQQIRHRRRQSKPESNSLNLQRDLDQSNQSNPSPPDMAAMPPQESNPMPGGSDPQAQCPKPQESDAGAIAGSDLIKSRSTFIDTPPIETSISSQSQTPTTPKKDLWAGGAIQTERRKAIESTNDWDSHRLAWSSRRKSAGEALLKKTALNTPAEAPCRTDLDLDAEQQPAKRNPKAFHKPWTPPSNQPRSDYTTGESSQSDTNVAATAQAFERLTGRFEGGLLYGYEPGFGLGGSAGTRGTKTGATRKSLHISQGYGVDLSDVPIFVAASK